MSLLMDALKKAEEEKRRAIAEAGSTTAERSIQESTPKNEAPSESKIDTSYNDPPLGDITAPHDLTKNPRWSLEPLDEYRQDHSTELPYERVSTRPNIEIADHEPRLSLDENNFFGDEQLNLARDKTFRTGGRPIPSLDSDRTLPSERAIQTSLKDYFDASQTIDRPKTVTTQERIEPPPFVAKGDTTRVTANTVFAATRTTGMPMALRLGLLTLLVIGLFSLPMWLYLNLKRPPTNPVGLPPLPPSVAVNTQQPPAVTPPTLPTVPEDIAVPRIDVPSEEIIQSNAELPLADSSKPEFAENSQGIQNPDLQLLQDTNVATSLEKPLSTQDNNPTTSMKTSQPEVKVDSAHLRKVTPQIKLKKKKKIPKKEPLIPDESDLPDAQRLTDRSVTGPGPSMLVVDQEAVKITRSNVNKIVNYTVNDAYQAYQKGNYSRAAAGYRAVLAEDPENRDAHLGLGAIAMQQRDTTTAIKHYNHLLENNPKDSLAAAALLNIRGTANTNASESKLKMLLDKEPRSPHIHFSLGNTYSRQARWADAQKAYFNAYTQDSKNPTYVYNLAVSLDRLGQNKAALTYYKKALDMAHYPGVSYNPAQIRARIRKLSSRF